MLTHQELLELLHYNPDTGEFRWCVMPRPGISVWSIAGGIITKGYRVIGYKKRLYRANRLAWFYMTGEWPKNMIDHLNGNKADDRWCNLREATHAQNCWNAKTPKTNKLGLKGVKETPNGKYQARITANGKDYHIGTYSTPQLAYSFRVLSAKLLHGKFARAG